VTQLVASGWHAQIERLAEVSGIDVVDYRSYIRALEKRRAFFKTMGATATDHACVTPNTAHLAPAEASALFERALQGGANAADAACFGAHMLMEMARMSTEDGLVMQIHAGSRRDYDTAIYSRFGPDKGADIPVPTEWTANLHALLDAYGNDRRFRVILFTLDESAYSRELAPLAGLYPAVLLGPPWWFHDSVNGMTRYLDRVMETAGLYNTAGFNDDTRAFPSIPSRHDVWRRVTCNWLAGLLVRGLIDEEDALEMAHDCAYRLPRRAYRLDGE
jgi:glucuronate isomerase